MLGTTNASNPSKSISYQNLIISINGTNKLTYNGSESKSLDISLASLGAAAANHNHDSVYTKHDHIHNYILYNNSAKNLKYGQPRLWLIQESSDYGGVKSWKNVLKVPHDNSEGYFTEWAINFTEEEAAYYRHMRAGKDSGFIKLVDAKNISSMVSGLTVAKAKNADTVGGLSAANFLRSNLTNIEFNLNGSLTGYGGFIDFHFNGSSADYTSRIIEGSSGCISINKMNVYNNHKCSAASIQSSTPPTDLLWAW